MSQARAHGLRRADSCGRPDQVGEAIGILTPDLNTLSELLAGHQPGDTVTVAPAQTLTDKEYQRMRDAARRIANALRAGADHRLVEITEPW